MDFGELRIIVDPKGDVWFVASDVAKSLGYINAKDAVKRHVDDDDSMLLQVSDNQWGVKRSILKTRYIDSIRIINESGLYSLILSSKLESAKRFKKWVTSEVLPSIRKTGEYKTSSGGKGILVPDFSNPADAARAWADQYEAAQKAIAEKSQAEAEAMRKKRDWPRLRAVPAPAKGTPSPGWGQLGRGNGVRVKYVSINSGLGGDRL